MQRASLRALCGHRAGQHCAVRPAALDGDLPSSSPGALFAQRCGRVQSHLFDSATGRRERGLHHAIARNSSRVVPGRDAVRYTERRRSLRGALRASDPLSAAPSDPLRSTANYRRRLPALFLGLDEARDED